MRHRLCDVFTPVLKYICFQGVSIFVSGASGYIDRLYHTVPTTVCPFVNYARCAAQTPTTSRKIMLPSHCSCARPRFLPPRADLQNPSQPGWQERAPVKGEYWSKGLLVPSRLLNATPLHVSARFADSLLANRFSSRQLCLSPGNYGIRNDDLIRNARIQVVLVGDFSMPPAAENDGECSAG